MEKVIAQCVENGGIRLRDIKMARGYEIEFITDERFGGTQKKLKAMIKKMQKTNVQILHEGSIREIDWSKENPTETPNRQWRKRYVIGKGNMKWKEVYGKINKIYAPYYKPIRF